MSGFLAFSIEHFRSRQQKERGKNVQERRGEEERKKERKEKKKEERRRKEERKKKLAFQIWIFAIFLKDYKVISCYL